MNPRWSSKFEVKPDRWVFVPTVESIENGKKIKSSIEERWTPPDDYYHLRDGGHVAAIKVHLENTSFIHLDIENFFGCVSKNRVTRTLKNIFKYEVAKEIAESSTVLNPTILPFGFVQSTIIASMCLYKSSLGSYLTVLKKSGITISVYMDDIILSTREEDIKVESSILSFEEIKFELIRRAEKSKFPLNVKKEEGPASRITAYNIYLSNQSLQIEPNRFSTFMDDYNSSNNEDVRKGIYGYVKSINSAHARMLIENF